MCAAGLTASKWELMVVNVYCTFLMLTLKIYEETENKPNVFAALPSPQPLTSRSTNKKMI